jgi:uncharacterized repeat protein (TIGR03843 family)
VSELDVSTALDLLRQGDISVEGRLVDASNTTLFCEITSGHASARCVYKPVAGERPLWDFPDGSLAGREVAAYAVSEALGWGVVPPTILRDGPFGPGMCQLWIDEERQDEPPLGFVPARKIPDGWRRVASARDERGRPYALAHADDARLARMAVFDAVINNADRKGGHILSTVDGQVHGVDHGVSFHTDDKLRTVLWGWADDPVPDDALEVLTRVRADLDGSLGAELAEHLTMRELRALCRRVDALRRTKVFPSPPEDWPALPWPPI